MSDFVSATKCLPRMGKATPFHVSPDLDGVSTVSLIGAGPIGCSFAADLASRGKKVLLYGHPDHPGNIGMIQENGGYLKASDEVQGTFRIETTSDLGVALQFSSFIVITVPAHGHDTILNALSRYDLRAHILIATPGNFFFLAARKRVAAQAFLETSHPPYATRMAGDTVLVKGVKDNLAIWAGPTTICPSKLRRAVESIFPRHLEWCDNLLQVALANIGPVIHPATALMNTGWIEVTRGDFYFYGQGMSDSVSKVIEQIDRERLAISREFGFQLPTIMVTLEQMYQKRFMKFRQFARESQIHNRTKGAPAEMGHRYVSEDVVYVLIPWYELGLKCGVNSPTIKSIIELASVVNGSNCVKGGRSLREVGLGDASKEEILKICQGVTLMGPKPLQNLPTTAGSWRYPQGIRFLVYK
ncbi:hypothetical protein BDV24DRAFT_151069 [Aspergillus arachidicola]|uniref:NAD/NADP octopine/nopaline dehydrogenase n=1 Tax=Aspergillus arachidicola TaxID=656916 RepID=A0A5N6Y904_9EURO|nr:hypothetical protein BDV24DRAFT_151069 [Aspergillus arachidicola]